MKALSFFILAFCLTLAGCLGFPGVSPIVKNPPQEDETLVVVQSPELAKMILRPKKGPIDVSRDPFHPLMDNIKLNDCFSISVDNLTDVCFLGTVKVNGKFSALVADSKGKDVYQLQSRIRNYTITSIEEDEITLTNGDNNIKIKRGTKP